MCQILILGRPRRRFRVLICDNEEVFRVGLRTVLRSLPQITVVAETAEPALALELSAALTPHLALVSSELGGDALPLVDALNRDGVRVIVVGAEPAGETDWVMGATAHAYLSRRASSVGVLECVRAAMPSQGDWRPECPHN